MTLNRLPRFLLTATLSLPAFAQDITIKSKTELVQVPVVVTDHGASVSGLTKDDFRLVHDGKLERIEVFEEVNIPATAANLPPLPPHTVQNFLAPGSRQDLVILVLDIRQGWPSTPNILASLKDMCRRFVETRTPVSVLLLTSTGLVQIHSFTSAPEDLTRVVAAVSNSDKFAQLPNGMPAGTLPSVLSEIGGRVGEQNDPLDSIVNDINDLRFSPSSMLDPVTTIAQAYSGIPGRKKLIWISTHFMGGSPAFVTMPTGEQAMRAFHMADAADEAWKRMSAANIAIYPIDSNGVQVPGWSEHFDVTHSGDRFTQLFPSGMVSKSSDTQSMRMAAEKTGGHACVNLLETCVAKADDDAKHYYILGFYLGHNAHTGWHKINVAAKSGLSIRARNGFIVATSAHPDTSIAASQSSASSNSRAPSPGLASARPTPANDAILAALAAPVDYTAVPLRLQWSAMAAQTDTSQVELRISSPPGGISLDPDTKELRIDVVAYVRSAASSKAPQLFRKRGDGLAQSISAHPDQQQKKDMETNGVTYIKKISLPRGRYIVRVLLRDNVTNKIGTVSTLIDLNSDPMPPPSN